MYSMITPPTDRERWQKRFDELYDAYCEAGLGSEKAADLASDETDKLMKEDQYENL